MNDFLPSGPWGVWWHPVRCYRTLIESRERMAVIEEERETRNREMENIMNRITDTQALLDEARGEIASLRGTLAERNVALGEAEAKIRRLTSELEEMQSVEDQIEDFRKMLGQAEDMKRRYEKRIEILRGRLREYDDRARVNDELNIEMDKRPVAATRPGTVSSDSDWLRPLDEI
ncbi:MAG: hypothetical protein K2O24_08215 [Muribaculaceae bacterium]|nr:hypothetical protein [Muribaculaceae bacterium]